MTGRATNRRVRRIGHGIVEPVAGALIFIYALVRTVEFFGRPSVGAVLSTVLWFALAFFALGSVALLVGGWVVRSPIFGWPVYRLRPPFEAWKKWGLQVVGGSGGRAYCFISWFPEESAPGEVVTKTLRILDEQWVAQSDQD